MALSSADIESYLGDKPDLELLEMLTQESQAKRQVRRRTATHHSNTMTIRILTVQSKPKGCGINFVTGHALRQSSARLRMKHSR